MLIVITSDKEIANETALINQLFENGLEVLHLRKPDTGIEGYRKLLDGINTEHHPKVVLHQFYGLVDEFNLKGVHLTERIRKDMGVDVNLFVGKTQEKGLTVSASFHDMDALKENKVEYDYALLSPVFSSISKKGYQGKGFEAASLKSTIVALGGIDEKSIAHACALGYKGVAVLGAVWNTGDSLQGFKSILNKYHHVYS